MGETERLTVEAISELQDKIATQYQIICSLDTMNDELQAKLGKIEQIVNKSYTEDEFYSVVQDIKEVLENG